MSLVKRLSLGCLFCLLTCFCFLQRTVVAQTAKPGAPAMEDHDQTLRQLLEEVHALRIAVQRATVNNTRFQMLIERVRLEQGRVDGLSRQLETTRKQIGEMTNYQTQLEQQIKDSQDVMDRTTDPERRLALESKIKEMKGNQGQLPRLLEQLRDQETQMDTELQAAKAKLAGLNADLDALMSELKGP